MACTARDKLCWGGDDTAHDFNQLQSTRLSSVEVDLRQLGKKIDFACAVLEKIDRAMEILAGLHRQGQDNSHSLNDISNCLRSAMAPMEVALGNIQNQNQNLLAGMASGKVETMITQQHKITYGKNGLQDDGNAHAVKESSTKYETSVEPPKAIEFKDELHAEFKSFKDSLQRVLLEQDDRLRQSMQDMVKTKTSEGSVEATTSGNVEAQTPRVAKVPNVMDVPRQNFLVAKQHEAQDDAFLRSAGTPIEKPPAPEQVVAIAPPPVVPPSPAPVRTVLKKKPSMSDLEYKGVNSFKPWACVECTNVNYSSQKNCLACDAPNPNQAGNQPYNGPDDDSEEASLKILEDHSFASVFLHESNPQKPMYTVEGAYKTTGCAQAIARSSSFHISNIIMVVLNAVWIGLETQAAGDVSNIYDAELWVIMVAEVFVIYFVGEWIIRLVAFKTLGLAFADGWFRFDTFLVFTMILDFWVLNVIFKLVEGDKVVKMPAAPLRTLRLLKLTRMARLMRAFPELVTMVKGLVRSLRATGSTILLLVLMDYVFAIILHMLLKDEIALNNTINDQSFLDWTTLWKSMWILAMNGTLLLDNTAPLLTEMWFGANWNVKLGGMIVCVYTVFAAILILNMLIGVLCELVSKVNEEQRAAADINLVRQELSLRLEAADDGDGCISHKELIAIMSDSKSKAVFRHLRINELFMLQMIEMMYRTEKKVTIAAALDLMLLCRSKNHATIDTLAGGFGFLAKQIDTIRQHIYKSAAFTQQDVDATIKNKVEELELEVLEGLERKMDRVEEQRVEGKMAAESHSS